MGIGASSIRVTSSSSLPDSHRLVSFLVTNITSLLSFVSQFSEVEILIILVLLTIFSQLKWIHRHYQIRLSFLITISILFLCHVKTRDSSYKHYVENDVCNINLSDDCLTEKEEMWNENYYESRFNDLNPMSSIAKDLYHLKGFWRNNDGVNEFKFRFRGINLPAKTPSEPKNLRKTKNARGLYETKRSVSFIDRPFPLDTSDEHFKRLSLYGFNFLRLTVTWEAVMHEGPGIIDEEYLNYLSKLVDKAADYGFYVIVDPHQDVWSRFTGGDGAPWWTLDAAGFNTDDSSIHESGCAWLHQHFPNDDDMPGMLWITNYFGLTTATMFTLFFAGDRYAPGINIVTNGTEVSIQTFLQDYYLQYIEIVAETLKEKQNVLGFNSMNEPNQGYVGMKNLKKSVVPVPLGYVQSAFDGMRLGSGETLNIDFYSSLFYFNKTKLLNPDNKSPWKSPEHDIWMKLGIFGIEGEDHKRVLKKTNYFSFDGDYCEEFLSPFYEKMQKSISKYNKRFVLYAEPHITEEINHAPKRLNSDEFVWSVHFYDAFILMFKIFLPWLAFRIDLAIPLFGSYFIDRGFRENLRKIKDSGKSLNVIIGETGIPFDLRPSSNPSKEQVNYALDRTLRAIEANNLEYILWNYYIENTDVDGDDWNKENLSIRANSLNRGVLSVARPFAYQYDARIEIISQQFDLKSKKFTLEVGFNSCDTGSEGGVMKLMIYVPQIHFRYPKIVVSFGTIDEYPSAQVINWSLTECHLTENPQLTIS